MKKVLLNKSDGHFLVSLTAGMRSCRAEMALSLSQRPRSGVQLSHGNEINPISQKLVKIKVLRIGLFL